MKRLTGWILLIAMMMLTAAPALAVDNSRSYVFDLTVNGQHEMHVMPGDIVTVVFTLDRMDSSESYTMYAVQNEIHYDDDFVEIVENGSIVAAEVETRDIALVDGNRSFYMNYVSFGDGVQWNAKHLVGTFQLKINGTSGATVLSNNNFKVSLRDGSDVYEATANDMTLIVSSDCIVHFETNGGSEMEDAIVLYGEMLERPEDPVREGYHVEGWYTDIDLTQLWDFENMPVKSNMTLYAKWAEGEPEPDGIFKQIGDWFSSLFDKIGAMFGNFDLSGVGDWLADIGMLLLIGLPVLLVVLLMILLLCRRKCRVIFVVNGGAPIEPMKVKRGETLQNLPIPVRGYSVFCGWYKDEKFTDPWYAGADKITKRKTKLYAKWL